MSTYHYSRSGYALEAATLQKRIACGDLVTLLGVANRLKIDILPITWTPALDHIGRGATAEIREVPANLQFSFAFKRPVLLSCLEFKSFESRLLPCLIAELSILGLESIRQHPNMVNLEGICWEVVSSEDENVSREAKHTSNKGGIIPILVFEKSKYGDLHHFMMQQTGKKLDFAQMIGICIDTRLLQRCITTPHNVLIFDNGIGGYIARVADFGYSTQWALPNDFIHMPRSRPWDAPEWHHRGFTPEQAMRMDSYSFGMVVLWLLGYATLEGQDDIFERELYTASEAADLACPLAESICKAHKLDLRQFFIATLSHNATTRSRNFEHLEEVLTAKKIARRKEIVRMTHHSRFVRDSNGTVTQELKDHVNLETADFQVIPVMYQFYDVDFRVRIHVFNALLSKLASLEGGNPENPTLQNLLLQCAVCYEIGFGVVRDPIKSQELISRCDGYDRANFTRELSLVKGNWYCWGLLDRVSTDYRKMISAETGNGAPENSLSLSYIRQKDVENIELQYRNEIIDVENSLRANHHFVFALKKELKKLMIHRGSQSEADDIEAQFKSRDMRLSVYDSTREVGDRHNQAAMISLSMKVGRAKEAEEDCRRALSLVADPQGTSHLIVMDLRWTLSAIMENQERWEEAGLILTQSMETSLKVLGPTHPDNIGRVGDLARIYAKQEKWEEAENLVAQSTEASIKIFGEDHQLSVKNVRLLWFIRFHQQYQRSPHQRDWTALEAQQIEVIRKCIKCYGRDHQLTITSMGELAVTWFEQRQWRVAEKLLKHVIKESERLSGNKDLVTFSHMDNLANGYNWKMTRMESLARISGKPQICDGILHRKVLEMSIEILGWHHLRTLNRAYWLGIILNSRRHLEEAEKLQVKTLEIRVGLQGENHPDILNDMRNLAVTIRKRGRLREAIEVMDKGLQGKSFLNRLYWRLRISLGLLY